MTTVTTKTFRSGNSEAVRLPKDIAYGRDIELEATRNGDIVILRPVKARRTPAETVALLRKIGFPSDGVQPREPFEYPDRPGLFD
ncbi:MAG: antitoxin [Sphingomonadaceae bacterium]